MDKYFKKMGITRIDLNNYLSGICYINGRWQDISFTPEQAEFLVDGFVKVLGGWYSSREQMRLILLYHPSLVKQCAILERLEYDVNLNKFQYTAGQLYPDELAVIRSIIRK
ncbi:MAG: hypothetical protein RRY36_09500 [Bacteroidaceae bacterium]